MINDETKRKLRELNMAELISGLELQQTEPATVSLSFDERMQRVIDYVYQAKYNNKIQSLIKSARLRFPQADIHSLYYDGRHLDKNLLNELFTCQYIDSHQSIIFQGPTGSGKTFLSCVLGKQACLRQTKTRNEQEILRKKSCVILPPQPVISKGNFDRYIGIETYEFVFLGAEAVRKGLLQLLTALLDVMKNCEKNIHLNVIGHIDKVSTSYGLVITQEESERCKQIIEENKNWITHYDYLQNEEVLNIFQKSHVGFLPTWADSFGFSVLEMQACGLPVVTTNVRAMTEINNQNIGWIAEVPCNSLKAGKYKSDWEKKQFAEILRKELIDIITDILSSNDEELRKKAMGSYFMIKNNRTIESHAAKLDALYSEIFD